jgi:hypothetical protein
LFGIPERTQDAHQHASQNQRLSGVLEASDCRTLGIIRHKKPKAA